MKNNNEKSVIDLIGYICSCKNKNLMDEISKLCDNCSNGDSAKCKTAIVIGKHGVRCLRKEHTEG